MVDAPAAGPALVAGPAALLAGDTTTRLAVAGALGVAGSVRGVRSGAVPVAGVLVPVGTTATVVLGSASSVFAVMPLVRAPPAFMSFFHAALVSFLLSGKSFWPWTLIGGRDIVSGVSPCCFHGSLLLTALVRNNPSGGLSICPVMTLGNAFFRLWFFFFASAGWTER